MTYRGALGDGLTLEAQAGRDEDAALAAARHHLDGTDGGAAQLEEVVVDADPIAAEDIRPDGGQGFLHGVARSDELRGGPRPRAVRSRQGTAGDPAGRGEGGGPPKKQGRTVARPGP